MLYNHKSGVLVHNKGLATILYILHLEREAEYHDGNL